MITIYILMKIFFYIKSRFLILYKIKIMMNMYFIKMGRLYFQPKRLLNLNSDAIKSSNILFNY